MTVSPTRYALDPETVGRLVTASLGPDTRVATAAPLEGGTYAAVWAATLHNGRTVVVKVAPPPHVRVLGYERRLLAAEARYLSAGQCFALQGGGG